MRKRSWHQYLLTEHDRRKLINSALGAGTEFVSPENDTDLQHRFPFGKYRDRTLADILERDPAYFAWLRDNVDLREGSLCSAFYAVIERYEDRIESASKFRRAERF